MTKILVVDDREEYRNIVSNCFLDYFCDTDLKVDLAVDAKDGLRKFTENSSYALVSSDCKMPGFNNEMSGEAGLEMISRINSLQYRTFRKKHNLYVPIMLVTGSDIPKEKIDYPDSKFLGVVQKTFNIQTRKDETFWKLYQFIVDSGLEFIVNEHEFAY